MNSIHPLDAVRGERLKIKYMLLAASEASETVLGVDSAKSGILYI